MHLVIFEGKRWRSFAPMALSRPVFSLATGRTSLLEKHLRHMRPDRLTLWVRPQLADYVRQRVAPRLPVPTSVNQPLDDEPTVLVSGRALLLSRWEHPESPCVVPDEEGGIRKAFVHAPGLAPQDPMDRTDRWMKLLDLPHAPAQSRMVNQPWDLIKWNEESLMADFVTLREASQPTPAGPYHVIEPDNIWLGQHVGLKPGVLLDASRGPVMIDHHATIGANAVLEGPCYIGAYAQVAPLTLIRPGSSIGMMCKVAGEIANSIMFGYSNKAHDGYLGDSYIGKWVNLGAGTTTSNLKNTYGEISFRGGEGQVMTGRRFLGSVIADHAKTAIGTRLMAGTYVGFAAMIAASGIAPRFVPSYSFLTDKGIEPYRLDKAIEVMKAVFARRDRQWNDVDDIIVRYVANAAPEVERA